MNMGFTVFCHLCMRQMGSLEYVLRSKSFRVVFKSILLLVKDEKFPQFGTGSLGRLAALVQSRLGVLKGNIVSGFV